MPGMKARVRVRLLVAGVAALTVGGTLDGCERALVGGAAGQGGSTGDAGRGGRGGTAGTGGTTGDGLGPACPPLTLGGPNVTKGGACSLSDIQSCFKPCGPESVGMKSETCTNGVYLEMAGCSFDPARDYSCYRIPVTANAACPAGVTPMAGGACAVAPCMLCNSLGGVDGGHFLDASGADKIGYCVCRADASGAPTWSCATTTSWPCPGGIGCSGLGGVGGVDTGGTGGGYGGTGGGDTGAAGTGGAGWVGSQPPCPTTVTKGGACAATDVQFCYKTCGPEKTGVKSETCQTTGVYAEMAGCLFDPSKDYSCYKIATTANTACGASAPMSGSACDVPQCTVCNSAQGLAGGVYLDSTGATKQGYCVCQAANSAGMRVWSCANDTAWPCPGSNIMGC